MQVTCVLKKLYKLLINLVLNIRFMAKKLKLGSGLENLINEKIKNSYSTSTTDTYSANYINTNFSKKIFVDRLSGVDLNNIKYHCFCGVNNDCTNWIGGYGYLLCIPLSVGSNYAIQIAFNESGDKKIRLCIDGKNWQNWTNL